MPINQDSLAFMLAVKPHMARDKNGNIIGELTIYKDMVLAVKDLGNAGFSNTYIAGVMGNIGVESLFNPNAKEKGGLGVGLFLYTPNSGSNINQRELDYKLWLKDNNLKHSFNSSILYLAYLLKKEDNRVERLNKFNATIKQLLSKFPRAKVILGNGLAFYNNLMKKGDKDAYRLKIRQLVLDYMKANNIQLEDYYSILEDVDKYTWTRAWDNDWKQDNGKIMSGPESRILWKTVNYNNPVPVSLTTEHFMDFYERPDSTRNHLNRRIEIGKLLLPHIRKMRNLEKGGELVLKKQGGGIANTVPSSYMLLKAMNPGTFLNISGGVNGALLITGGQITTAGVDMLSNLIPGLDYSDSKRANLALGLDTGYDVASNLVSMVPGVGTAIGAAMKGVKLLSKGLDAIGVGTNRMTRADAILDSPFLKLTPWGLANAIGAKKTDTFEGNDETNQLIGSSYGGALSKFDDAEDISGKKYGLFSRKKMNEANEDIAEALRQLNVMTGIAEQAADDMLASANPLLQNRMSIARSGGIRFGTVG